MYNDRSKNMKKRRLKIIANPVSGRGSTGRSIPRLREELAARGFETDLFLTDKRGAARSFAASADGYDAFICVGGDGTVSEVINGIDLDRIMPIAVLPAGTGNVLAKELKLPRHTGRLADIVARGSTVSIDVGVDTLHGRRFCMMASAGFDSAVVHRFSVARKGTMHMWQYLLWGMKVVESYAMQPIRVEVDGKVVEKKAGYVLVSNVRSYGGPLTFVPQADPRDGLFDIFVIRRRRKRDLIRFFSFGFLTYLTGQHFRMGDCLHLTGREVSLSSDAMVPVQMDGDAAGFLPVRLSVDPRRLSLMVPAPPA
ncbi:MAG: hypothetical protein A2Z34_11725 [Planctomycetes bacterium RBG_16_59_8]|nr:MAG: hypothetical protein A2Z34_11725 [Planctomycetes bacterium RBG_16_59_8]